VTIILDQARGNGRRAKRSCVYLAIKSRLFGTRVGVPSNTVNKRSDRCSHRQRPNSTYFELSVDNKSYSKLYNMLTCEDV